MLPVWIQDIYVCVLASNHCPYANPELSLQGYFCRKAVMTNYKLFVLIYPCVLTFLICVTLAKCYGHYGCFCLEGQCLLAFVNGNLHSEQYRVCEELNPCKSCLDVLCNGYWASEIFSGWRSVLGGYRGKLQSSCSKTVLSPFFYIHLIEIENYFDCWGTVTFILRNC